MTFSSTPSLPHRELGSTGMELSAIGLGSWAFGGEGWRFSWGGQDDARSIATVHAAVAQGVNWIDTAAVYGLGHSEEVIGKAIAQLPQAERPFVFTKVGLVWDPANPSAAPRRIMRPDSVRRELEDSLRRLGVEAIDLYQVHWPDTGAPLDWDGDGKEAGTAVRAKPLEEYWQTMADLRREGKIRAIGLSNHDPAQLAAAAAVAPVDAIQPPLSLLNRAARPEIDWAADHGTGVIVYQPLHSGLLSGTFSKERVDSLAPGDWRRTHPDFTRDLDRNLAVVERLRTVAERHGASVGATAIAWALAQRGVTGAIAGARGPEQVADWARAASLELTAEDLTHLE
ncbi:aldo/keto reductase [Streptomyces sp. VRA16 Mangrove soil]|uniref:aldo/keto reductase n=1 Tax=Streptomyces sp. VRA16 Mangrove soil TaxID=2817434 RepID=UPI001A9F13B1|nr:aldo/keto reductase [Streptomyces sp. VRA16 Mangrove soil]MBO1335972.1 aldo/keto reductase [Streptomyces sp. VRA16 Mangrove soil]